jgi:hypothetical protein
MFITVPIHFLVQPKANRRARQNYRCGNLNVLGNITLLYIPPYWPELNPKIKLWDEIRENNLQELLRSNP